MTSFWQLIVPEAATNYVENPSFERNVTDGWSLTNGARWQSDNRQVFGAHCAVLRAASGLSARFDSNSLSVADGETVTVSIYAWRGTEFTAYLALRDTTNNVTRGTDYTSMTKGWERLSVSWTNDTGGAVDIELWVYNNAMDGSRAIYLDGAMMTLLDHETTYVDGDQPGCEWNGEPHSSTSTRSAQSRAGGRLYDLEDYGFYPEGQVGTGMPPIELDVQELALLPGAVLAGAKTRARQFAIPGRFTGGSMSDLHDKRKSLIAVLHPHAVPGTQPVRLRYTGATTTKQIAAHYRGGLELRRRAQDGFLERDVAIQFLAEDPHWYAVGERAVALDTSDSATLRYIDRPDRSPIRAGGSLYMRWPRTRRTSTSAGCSRIGAATRTRITSCAITRRMARIRRSRR